MTHEAGQARHKKPRSGAAFRLNTDDYLISRTSFSLALLISSIFLISSSVSF